MFNLNELILLYWVLPTLLTSLFMISYLRADDVLLTDFDAETWVHFILVVAIYPVTWCVLIEQELWPKLLRWVK